MIIGSRIIFLENLPSTNSHAVSLNRETKLPEGTVIRTNYQSAGRGQGRNSWESERDMNLLISIILYPDSLRPGEQFFLSAAVSLGICDFLRRYTSGIFIKWPNDIYVKDDKIAGILIENSVMGDRLEQAVAGIGLNINQEKFISAAPNPVSLRNLTGVKHDLNECLGQLLADTDKRYKSLTAGDYDSLMSDYRQLLYRKNQWKLFSDSGGIFRGRVVDAGIDGRLKVEKESGDFFQYAFGEIGFIL